MGDDSCAAQAGRPPASLLALALGSPTCEPGQLLQPPLLLLKWRLLASQELLGAAYCMLLE